MGRDSLTFTLLGSKAESLAGSEAGAGAGAAAAAAAGLAASFLGSGFLGGMLSVLGAPVEVGPKKEAKEER